VSRRDIATLRADVESLAVERGHRINWFDVNRVTFGGIQKGECLCGVHVTVNDVAGSTSQIAGTFGGQQPCRFWKIPRESPTTTNNPQEPKS
jgi:hypothetical protein